MLKSILVILFTMITMGSLLSITTLISASNIYGQNGPFATSQANSQTENQNSNNIASSMPAGGSIVSTYVPLSGQLAKGYYIHLIDWTGFKVSKIVISMQVPCDFSGKPQVGLIAGVGSQLNTINVGNPVGSANLDGKPSLNLSSKGTSCLYKAFLPAGITDVELINIAAIPVSFSQGLSQYGITITAQIS